MQKCPNCGYGGLAEAGFPDGLFHQFTAINKHRAVGPSSLPSSDAVYWVIPDAALHLNTDLPPVDCPLLVKVPAGTEFTYLADGRIWKLDVPVLLRVKRKHWERSKTATPTYFDEFNNEISGKFEWTYP